MLANLVREMVIVVFTEMLCHSFCKRFSVTKGILYKLLPWDTAAMIILRKNNISDINKRRGVTKSLSGRLLSTGYLWSKTFSYFSFIVRDFQTCFTVFQKRNTCYKLPKYLKKFKEICLFWKFFLRQTILNFNDLKEI